MTQGEAYRLLLTMMQDLKDDVAAEREASRQSRGAIRDRVEDVVERLGKLETTMAVAGQVDAQVRDEIDALRASIEENRAAVQPTVDEWRRIKTIGIGLVGLLALGGLSVGAALAWAGEGAVNAVRAWLRIS
ncbi:hypothetical protein GCM10011321_14460 [Youhaiella tibetensis]|uniref:DUF1515 domain-containing protein n=1 Tax=Paradevosia tibetensis TaxID=1447062 RepID=A0A5B9DM65_9HYPH|nr:DUF1515 domain-containing protein [Youhaiella tibetensis]QEE20431.1 DUF1515 domain-containing protein [Youhaiella tibetensis]GGF24200.1 hypothetical protein GCM10011321_14460 [Youhaiella tibetensis]